MNYSIKENTKKEATLEIVVSSEEFAKGLDFAFNKNKKYFSIPGFRKGKVPRKMVEKYYGVEVLFEDAVNEIIPEKYQEAAVDSKLDIVSKPEIDIVSISVEEGFVFTAKVELKPEVKVKDYKGIKAPKNEYPVKSDAVNKEIDALKEKTVRIIERENGKVEKGDIVNIDYEGFCDGVAFPGGKAEGFDLTIGSGQFIPGFEDALIGCELGATEIEVKFPEEYHAEDLKGKPATFKVVINKISYKEYPALDDDFAKDVSEFDTIKELKADIKKKLTAEAKQRADQEFENAVVEKLLDLVEVEVPYCMIEERIESLANDFAYRLKSQGMELAQYLQLTGMTEDSFKAQFKDRAESQVKVSLALEEIAKIEKIEVTDKDVEKELEKMAEAYNMEVDKIKQFINPDDIKADLKMNKTVEFVVKHAVVEEAVETEEKAEKKPAAKKTATKKATTKKAEGESAPKKTTAKKSTAKKKEEK
ncbi:MAG: trigger factor [Ruminococcaceae bacterium]|nr:trigger factor [Oscillospiraceae bacterium]